MSHRTSTSEGKPMSLEPTPQLCKVQPPGSALPCSVPQPGRRQGNLPQAHALSAPCLAFKGAFLCQDPMGTSHPQELSRSHSRLLRGRTTPGQGPRLSRSHQAHHLQKHRSTSSSAGPSAPRGARRWRVAAACMALPAVRSQPAEHPGPEQPTAAATWPRQPAENTACTS